MDEAMTMAELLQGALAAYEELATLAETVDDEWTYITDLGAAWRERMEAAVEARGHEATRAPEQAAVDRAIDEIGRITDPHRAIDWLSTYPQVVLSAIGEQP